MADPPTGARSRASCHHNRTKKHTDRRTGNPCTNDHGLNQETCTNGKRAGSRGPGSRGADQHRNQHGTKRATLIHAARTELKEVRDNQDELQTHNEKLQEEVVAGKRDARTPTRSWNVVRRSRTRSRFYRTSRSLSKADKRLSKYEKLPRGSLLAEKLKERTYFDSGDFSLSAADRETDSGTTKTGKAHTYRDSISHPYASIPASNNAQMQNIYCKRKTSIVNMFADVFEIREF
ncbi:Endosulphine [Penicillium chrysogenum]|uniref:Endosulphine n=1 Tax=Penicillium chrysogenum TaxID=5076 RepID=UPI0024DF1475|nr:Endosulphine [Penicillium chrysogenum]KAJ5244752.1 Endosulphine [Penicillium chrysogenum]